jgi:riboflavin synthase
MFTGLVAGCLPVRSVETSSEGATISLPLPPTHRQKERLLAVGDSIALDGACYTVARMTDDTFTVIASPETLSKTIAHAYTPGRPIHFEHPLRLMDPLGGHMVTGHVDVVGRVLQINHRGNSIDVRIGVPTRDLSMLLVSKGSVAVNGVSLTVNAVHDLAPDEADALTQQGFGPLASWFEFCCIPHTWEVTALDNLMVDAASPWNLVNLEMDLTAKHIQRMQTAWR